MYDVLVRSAIFGTRNADKIINHGDTGRIFADLGQWTNAVNAASKLDNSLGKGAKAAVDAMSQLSNSNKVVNAAGKGLKWASKNVNPLLVGAAGYRVCKAKDKEAALKREIFGMTTMFGVEGIIKEAFKSQAFQNFKNTHSKFAPFIGIAEGVLFVCGSIAASTTGYKIGKHLFPEKKSKNDSLIESINKLEEAKKANPDLEKALNTKNEAKENQFLIETNKKLLA